MVTEREFEIIILEIGIDTVNLRFALGLLKQGRVYKSFISSYAFYFIFNIYK